MNLDDLKKIDDRNLDKVKPLTLFSKLTGWKNEPSIHDLKRDFQNTQSSHSKYIANLKRWVELYDAPKFGNDKHKGSRVNPKMTRKQAEWRCPALSEPFLSTNQLYEVKPLTFDDVHRAEQNALILNMQFNTQLKRVNLVDKIIRSVVKNGTAIVRLGWEYQEQEVVEQVEQFEYLPIQPLNIPPELAEQMGQVDESSQLQQQYENLAKLRQFEPDSYEQLPSELKAGFEMSEKTRQLLKATFIGFKQEKKVKPVVNKPTVEVCNLHNVYIDPTCKGDIDKAQFIVHSYESSLSDLKRSGLYKNLDRLDTALQGDNHFYHSSNTGFSFNDKARKKLVVYEYWGYWDIDGTGIVKPIVASWVGDVLIRMEENPFPDKKLPFVIFNYLPEEDSIYGEPDAELIEDNQLIAGAITRGMIDLIGKSANSQTGYSKGFLDSTNKIKFRRGEDYEYNPNMHPANAVFTHKYPELPNSALTMVQMMSNEAESLSGVKAFTGTGISASYLGDTAAGARGVLDAVSKREMSILRRISVGFIEIGRKIMAMNAVWLSEEEVVRVTNSEFIKVRRDDLLGNFDLSLGISTAEEKESKSKQLAFLLQTTGNTMGHGLMQKMLSKIAYLSNMPDLAKEILEYVPEPDPMQQQIQQLEVERLQAEIELLRSQANENNAKSQVQSAKVMTEQAKANNLQSDADNKTLDFMERDTGVKHQQVLEKQAMINQGANEQQQLKNVGLSQQVADKHNSSLIQQFMQQPAVSLNQPQMKNIQ